MLSTLDEAAIGATESVAEAVLELQMAVVDRPALAPLAAPEEQEALVGIVIKNSPGENKF